MVRAHMAARRGEAAGAPMDAGLFVAPDCRFGLRLGSGRRGFGEVPPARGFGEAAVGAPMTSSMRPLRCKRAFGGGLSGLACGRCVPAARSSRLTGRPTSEALVTRCVLAGVRRFAAFALLEKASTKGS